MAGREISGRISKMLGRGCLVLIAIPIVFLAALMYSMRPDHKPSFLVDVTVEMTVNGELVRIGRTIECKSFKIASGGLESIGRRQQTRYAATVGAFGARLSDGSAILIWNPYRCAREFPEGTEDLSEWEVPPVPTRAKPYIAWTQNANDPATIEFYIDSRYLDRPESRVQGVSMRISRSPVGARASPQDEFDAFTSSLLPQESGENRKAIASYSAYATASLDRSKWHGYDREFDSSLEKYLAPTILSNKPLANGHIESHIASQLFEKNNLHSLELPRQWRQEPNWSREVLPHLLLLDSAQSYFDHDFFQLTFDEGVLVFEPRPFEGYVLLERKSQASPQTMEPVGSLPIKYNNIVIYPERVVARRSGQETLFHFSEFLFDPTTQRIFAIQRQSLILYARPGPNLWRSISSIRR